ncbi:MAG: hypothetical protein IPJ98_10870 [Bryobacterales bacterium]|nr:hypothetical protein [Bryobacterales bacterium]
MPHSFPPSSRIPRRSILQTFAALGAASPAFPQGRQGPNLSKALPEGVTPGSALLAAGCLDVTQAPYLADPSGKRDATAAIQRAVNDARDHQLVCFFPTGTYLLSDTISCQQPVEKAAKPRFTDGMRQSYWDIPNRTCILIGSTAGRRPVLKLAPTAKGFDDPAKPKNLVHIWAQTRNDAPGKEEPEWGKEQPNISFGHTFRGIDIDVRGHAGAVGIRHTGSQGATMLDVRILAEGAYAGMNNCPGQGGGTYNIEVIGGQYGLLSGPECRFPMLAACVFEGQTTAPVSHASQSPPMLLVGCRIDTSAPAAIDLTKNPALTAVSLVDCVIRLRKPGRVFAVHGRENLFLEDCFVQGAIAAREGGASIPQPERWTKVTRYVAAVAKSAICRNGEVTTEGEVAEWSATPAAPDYAALHARHWSRTPSFEDRDAVNVRSLGAKGDGTTDDTAALEAALAKGGKLFLPRGIYRVSKPLALRAGTALFGLHRSLASLRFDGLDPERPVATMPDDPAAQVSFTFVSLGGLVDWTAGRGLVFLSPAVLRIRGNGGGRFCGVTGIGRGFRVDGTRERVAFYSLNVERIRTNPQSEIRNARNVRIYYLKVEAAPHGYGVGVAEGTGNTPLGITDSRDIRLYGVNGNVVTAEKRPMIDITNSDQILVFHAKSFKTGDFAQIRETRAGKSVEIPSDRAAALLIRD